MPFVAWHYRNGYYVRSHFRRLPWRRADTSTPPLFALAGAPAPTIPAAAPAVPDPSPRRVRTARAAVLRSVTPDRAAPAPTAGTPARRRM